LEFGQGEKPRLPRVYTNHANVYATPYDIILEAGVKSPPSEEVTPACQLVMSPQMAKVVAQILSASVQQWEEKHGEIKLSGQVMRGPTGRSQPS